MAKPSNLLLNLSILIITKSALSQTCTNYKFSNNRLFSFCNDLPVLNSFLHYTYNPYSSNLQIAYRHTNLTPSKWVAWGVNPTSTGMLGAQAIVAYLQSDGVIRAYTSPIGSYQTSLEEGGLSFNVSELFAIYQNSEMIVFASLDLSFVSGGVVNVVWQDGFVSGNSLLPHPSFGDNVRSVSSLNVVSGVSASSTSTGGGGGGGGAYKLQERNIHGILNVISWGIMIPLGAIIARYLKVSKSAGLTWFYSHLSCQSLAYIIGVAGFATGLKLGVESPSIQFTTHRTIGIALFVLATLQVFALFLRPRPEHKSRHYWNIYHHTIGYTVIILSVVNIFKGLEILSPEKQWRNAYTVVIVALGLAAAMLETFTWFVFIKRRNEEDSAKTSELENA